MNKEDKRTYDKKYYEDNSEKIKERTKKYYKIHRQQRLKYHKQWRLDNKEKIKTYHHHYYFDNSDKIKACNKRWRLDNPEKIKKWRERNPEYRKICYLANRERELEQVKKWREKNIEHRKEYKKKYLQTEEGKMFNQKSQYIRRARMRKLINTLTFQEWLDILEEHDYRCAYCGTEFDCELLPEKDHIIPISKGGNNTKDNVVPACRFCNSKKNNKLIYEFKEAI